MIDEENVGIRKQYTTWAGPHHVTVFEWTDGVTTMVCMKCKSQAASALAYGPCHDKMIDQKCVK